MQKPTTLVLNWHTTEACNYRCRYCYAKWGESDCRRELIHNPERTSALLSELHRFFRPDNKLNPLNSQMTWDSVRLNLAGGEPLLNTEKIPAIIGQAIRLGFEVSLITNGSHLSENLLSQLAHQLTWLGISIDSANTAANREIGRIDRRGRLLNLDNLANILTAARKLNPKLRIKLNTVVNQINHEEDLAALVQHIAPDKWKVLRMLPVVNHHLAVSDELFAAFIARHRAFVSILINSATDSRDKTAKYSHVQAATDSHPKSAT